MESATLFTDAHHQTLSIQSRCFHCLGFAKESQSQFRILQILASLLALYVTWVPVTMAWHVVRF